MKTMQILTKLSVLALLVLIAVGVNAQPTIKIKTADDVKKAQDTIEVIFQNVQNDSLKGESPTLKFQLENPNIKRTEVVVGKNKKVFVYTNKNGDVVKTTQISIFGDKARPKNRVFFATSFDLGFNNVDSDNFFTGKDAGTGVNDPDNFPNLRNGKSVSFAMYANIGYWVVPRNFAIYSGIGFEWQNYRFDNQTTIVSNNGVTSAVPITEFNSVSKSKLTVSYLNVPLMAHFNIPLSKDKYEGLFIDAGVVGGLNLGYHTKIKSSGKHKSRDELNIPLVRYGLSAKVGYKDFGFFANYYMNSLFEKNKGPQVYPFVIGVTFNLL